MNRRHLLVSLLAVAALALPATAPARDRDPFQLEEATIAQIQQAFRSGNLTPEDLVKMYLARIAKFDQGGSQPLNQGSGPQPLNSFMHVNEDALEDARRADLDDLEGDDDDGGKPLFGIPIILKDNIATKDMPTTAGSVALGASKPEKNAFIARKLRRAGAIILGKGTLTEFANFIALGMPTGFSSQLRFQLFQPPFKGDLALVGFGFNPYDPRVDPRKLFNPATGKRDLPLDGRPILATGGSSSGPGIAVAANLATVGVGTETSGSILSPSGQNSLVGIKPTVGLVSRHGIVPITADQDTAGPMARTVTDAAKLLGVLAGFDEKDPATRACLKPGNCLRDYTQFLNEDALKGVRIAVPKNPYWTAAFGLGQPRTDLMNAAIKTMTAMGATFVDCDIPSRLALTGNDDVNDPNTIGQGAFNTCVTKNDVLARKADPLFCTTVLMFGFKRDLNAYLADKDFGPGVSVSNAEIPVRTVRNLSDVVDFNSCDNRDAPDFAKCAPARVALKYPIPPAAGLAPGQAIAAGSDFLNTHSGSEDTQNYQKDRERDLLLTRTCGLDILFNGADPNVIAQCTKALGARFTPPPDTPEHRCTQKFDAVLFPANFGANAPARAGYPSVIVPGGFFPNPAGGLPAGFNAKPSPFGVTFTGPAFSEPRLIGFAFAFEQATQHRVPPALPAK